MMVVLPVDLGVRPRVQRDAFPGEKSLLETCFARAVPMRRSTGFGGASEIGDPSSAADEVGRAEGFYFTPDPLDARREEVMERWARCCAAHRPPLPGTGR